MTIKDKILIGSKKGQQNLAGSQFRKTLIIIIGIILIFSVLGDTSSEIGNAAGNMTAAEVNTTDAGNVYPFTSFFAKKGVLLLAFMGGIVLTMVASFLGKSS